MSVLYIIVDHETLTQVVDKTFASYDEAEAYQKGLGLDYNICELPTPQLRDDPGFDRPKSRPSRLDVLWPVKEVWS